MENLVSDAADTNNSLPNCESNVVKLAPLGSGSPDSLVEAKGVCSVIIVSYKTGGVLLDCIRSVLRQTKLHQLILVDNGNTKQTVQQLNEIADKNPKFEIITGHGNVGFSKGCNLGVRRARGEYILLLNPDSILQVDTLIPALEVFQTRPNTSLLTVRIENVDGTEQRGARRNLMTPWTCCVEQFRLDRLAPNHPHFKRLNLTEPPPLAEIAPVQCISGAFMLMPKRVFIELGGMDEEYFLHVEDIDFCLRIEKINGSILYLPQVSVTHRKGSSDSFPGIVEWHKARSFCKYFKKHFTEQYPAWALKALSLAIYLRLTIILPKITFLWFGRKLLGR